MCDRVLAVSISPSISAVAYLTSSAKIEARLALSPRQVVGEYEEQTGSPYLLENTAWHAGLTFYEEMSSQITPHAP